MAKKPKAQIRQENKTERTRLRMEAKVVSKQEKFAAQSVAYSNGIDPNKEKFGMIKSVTQSVAQAAVAISTGGTAGNIGDNNFMDGGNNGLIGNTPRTAGGNSANGGIMQWIEENPLLAGVIALGIALLAFFGFRKNNKR